MAEQIGGIEEVEEKENVQYVIKMKATEKKELQELIKKMKRREKKRLGRTPTVAEILIGALKFRLENEKKVEEIGLVEEETRKVEAEIESLKEVLPGYLKNKIAIIPKEGYIKVVADRRALGKWYTALKLTLKEMGFRFDWNSYAWVKPVALSEEEISRLFNFKRPDNLPERPKPPVRKEKERMVLGYRIVRGQDGKLWAVSKSGEWISLGLDYFDFNVVRAKLEAWERKSSSYIY